MKSLPIATVAVLLLTGVSTASPAAADGDWRHHTACDYRVCLVVLDDEDDSDGDGIADVDEIALGTDMLDRLSLPASQKLIDQALMRELPSFESHLTELVVLPQMTPDFSALATAVGLMDLPTDSWGTKNVPGLFGKLHDNGLTGILSGFGIDLPSSGQNELPQGSDASHITYMEWVSDTTTSMSDFPFPYRPSGFNAGKQGETTFGAIDMKTQDGTTRIDFGTSTNFPDGSHDGSTYSGKATKTGIETHATTLSTDWMGDPKTKTQIDYSRSKDAKTGVTTETTTVTVTTFDKNGNPTGSTSTETKVDSKNGQKTTTVTTTTTDADGKKTTQKSDPKTEKCTTKDCSGGMSDPDYVTFGPLTADDYRKVAVRLGEVRTPGPDSGILTDAPPQIPTRDIYSNYSGDGVVVLSATPNPRFNIAQPEYNGELAEMAQLGGTVPPNPNADDPTGYWPDKP